MSEHDVAAKLDEILRLLDAQAKQIEELQYATKLKERPKVETKPWVAPNPNRLIDAVVNGMNPGEMVTLGRMKPAPGDGRAWNDQRRKG